LLSLFKRDDSSAEPASLQRPGGGIHRIPSSDSLASTMKPFRTLEQTSASEQGRRSATAITTPANYERVRVPQLNSIAEDPCIVTSEPSPKSKKKADRRELKETEAPIAPIAMPIPRSAKLTNVVAAMEKSSNAIATDSSPVGELDVPRLDEGKGKARQAPSAATQAPITDVGAQAKIAQSDNSHKDDLVHQLMDPHADQAGIQYMDLSSMDIARIRAAQPVISDVMLHPKIAEGDWMQWEKLVLRLLDSTEDPQNVLSELYFFPGKDPISDHEVAAWQQATDELLEQVKDLRKSVDRKPSLNFKEPSEISFFEQGLGIDVFGLGHISRTRTADEEMFVDRGPSREEFLRGALKPGYWEECAPKEFAARRSQAIEGECAAQSLIEFSQDYSTMSPPQPRITSARSNSEDIWEPDAVPTTESNKNGISWAIPREPMSRIKRRG